MPNPRHTMTEKDFEARTAKCSICGPTTLRKNGSSWICAGKSSTSHAAWVKANPGKAAANRRGNSSHVLSNRLPAEMLADCSVCGPGVRTEWYGTGQACAASPGVLRRGVQQAAPQPRCSVCDALVRADGECPWCPENDRLTDWTRLLAHDEFYDRRNADAIQELNEAWGEDQWSMYSPRHELDIDDLPRAESAVPGWKTLGSMKPWNQA